MKKVLLYGEYSRVHWTLAQGLRELGVDVKVASSGDTWKDYPRDIELNPKNKFDIIKIIAKHFYSPDFRNYDVVQLINYKLFLKRHNYVNYRILETLRKNNNKIVLGAFGDDYYWVRSCLDKIFDYSFLGLYQTDKELMLKDANAQNAIKHNTPTFHKFNKYVAESSVNIIAGTYDYWLPYYKSEFSNKLKFIPFPININEIKYHPNKLKNNKIVFFVGIQRNRYFWKGLDLICPILDELKKRYSNDVELCYVENVPYNEYEKLMNNANVVVDQVYSMGQGMNALIALAKGKIVMTGAEEAHYSLIGESENKPIINIQPDKKQIQNQLEFILDSRSDFENWGLRCRKYIENHHNYIDVAQQYCETWKLYDK